MSKIALIAGGGNLPIVWAKAAAEEGVDVIAYQLIETADRSLEDYVQKVKKISIGQLDKLINRLVNDEIEEVLMLGKIEKALLHQGLELDDRFKRIIASQPNRSSDSITRAIIEEFHNEGIKILEQCLFLDKLRVEAGLLTKAKPDQEVMADINYGFKMAREIARLEIGQTVVVKNREVLAVEGIEGTDKTILRAGEYAGAGTVVAKANKPGQDYRFDLPTVGDITLTKLIKIKARALVLEAGSTFIIDKEDFLEKAEKNRIAVFAINSANGVD